MLYGLLYNLNIVSSISFQRVARLKQFHPLIKPIFSQKSSIRVSPGLTFQVLRYSNHGSCKMAATGSVVPSGDMVVDSLVPSFGNVECFVKPDGVFFCGKSSMICRRAGMSTRMGEANGCHWFHESKRLLITSGSISRRGQRNAWMQSYSCYSDRAGPEVSVDSSLSMEQLSSLALSAEQKSGIHDTLKLVSGACYLPHPAKEETGGEDAHFICTDEQAVGVADGVGGWADVGVDAGEYARELMSNSVEAIKELPDDDTDLLRVLEIAHGRTEAMGSSTACLIALKYQDLHAINLGDSGFIIIRDGRTMFESPVQQHDFNFPYQLERGEMGDPPSCGQVFKIRVVAGDVIVLGSDGLFDNMYSSEIEVIVSDAVKEKLDPDATAEKIAASARTRALDTKKQTPFSAAAQQSGYPFYGGKLDDLTVVVSYVFPSTSW